MRLLDIIGQPRLSLARATKGSKRGEKESQNSSEREKQAALAAPSSAERTNQGASVLPHLTKHAPHNHTSIKNNTRTKEAKIDMNCSKPRMTRVEKKSTRKMGKKSPLPTPQTPLSDAGRQK